MLNFGFLLELANAETLGFWVKAKNNSSIKTGFDFNNELWIYPLWWILHVFGEMGEGSCKLETISGPWMQFVMAAHTPTLSTYGKDQEEGLNCKLAPVSDAQQNCVVPNEILQMHMIWFRRTETKSFLSPLTNGQN